MAMNPFCVQLLDKYTIPFVMVIVGLVCTSETIVVIAQSNSTNSGKRNIIVTWLEPNGTKSSDNTLVISSEDFRKIFEQLLRQSIDGYTISNK